MSRDARGRFLTGGKPGPGRPPGSRNRLAEDFLADLSEDWKKHGSAAVAKVRLQNPSAYLRIVASILPRELPPPTYSAEYDDLTGPELVELFEQEFLKFKANVARDAKGPAHKKAQRNLGA